MSRASRLLHACRREPVDTTPVWLMRQAGRYLPEYRALRERHAFLEMVQTPDLATEITLQPLRRFELDAAIIFADILPPLAAMGLQLAFAAGEGPVIGNPVRDRAAVAALAVPEPREALAPTLQAIAQVRRELAGQVPLIGFAGAPFTLACYAIEGGATRQFSRTKALMHGQPQVWDQLMDKLATVVGEYLRAQVEAGAQVLQLFDSWVGALSPTDYRDRVLPYSRRVLQLAAAATPRVPLIHFGVGNGTWLPLWRSAGADVIGLDWHVELAQAWDTLGPDVAVQGNLDPDLLLAPVAACRRQAAAILDSVAGRNGHLFNLGHGILKETPVEHVAALVDFVHEYARRPAAGGH